MISVIVPYNKDRGGLDKCVASIEAQTYESFEIILSKGPGTVGQNFNIGLNKAKGEFVKYVCEDDWLPPTALQDLRDGMNGHEWVCANSYMVMDSHIDGPKVEINKSKRLTFAETLKQNGIHGGTTLYRTELLRQYGGMDESLQTGEEYDMHLALMRDGHIPGYVDKVVYYYKIWIGQKSSRDRRFRKPWRINQLQLIKDRHDKRNSTI